MLGFVAFVAVLNLFLGYALAVYLGTGGLPTAPRRLRDEQPAEGRFPAAARGILAMHSDDAVESGLKESESAVLDALDADAVNESAVGPKPVGAGVPSVSAGAGAPAVAPPAASCAASEAAAVAGVSPETASEIVAAAAASPPATLVAGPACEASELSAGMATREYAKQMLMGLAAAAGPSQAPTSVALVEVDASVASNGSIDNRLLGGVAKMARELLDESHLAVRFDDRQFLLMLAGDDERYATQRTEMVRQRIEATEFTANGRGMQATITCALARVSHDDPVDRLLETLQETLEEAKRFGGNRTFLHDGVSPAPVVPPELNYAKQTCEI
jgi:GGDEF domain-containing protein